MEGHVGVCDGLGKVHGQDDPNYVCVGDEQIKHGLD